MSSHSLTDRRGVARRAALAAALGAMLLALAGCGGKPERTPAQQLRDPKAPIASVMLIDPKRFAGRWRVAASGIPGCAGAAQDWKWDGGARFDVSGVDCASGGRATALTGRMTLDGPGARFTPDQGYGRSRVWVLWFDQSYRIAVLGAPSGGFATVLSRDYPPRADLMKAARDVLGFNGYDLRRVGR